MGARLNGVNYNTLAAVDGFAEVLRLVARWSVELDPRADRFRRVCKAFDYCWTLARKLADINARAGTRVTLACFVSGDAYAASKVSKKREQLKEEHVLAAFKVTTFRQSSTSGHPSLVTVVHAEMAPLKIDGAPFGLAAL